MTTLLRLLAVLACAVLAAGCGLRSASGAVLEAKSGSITHYDSLEGVKITVAAKDFTEQLILGNMLATILSVAGADVTNMTNTPGSFGVRQAMLNGDANISPEYTGTGWINYLGNEQPIKDETGQWKAVDEAMPADYDWAVGLAQAFREAGHPFGIRRGEHVRRPEFRHRCADSRASAATPTRAGPRRAR